jgi:hypothetical protein
MNFNELEVLSFIDNKFKLLSYMTRDTCDSRDIAVLYSRCP